MLYSVLKELAKGKGDKPQDIVSLEDYIGFDKAAPIHHEAENNLPEVTVHLSALPGLDSGLNHRDSDDEDDVVISGSGSGSGDNYLVLKQSENNGHLTPTQTTVVVNGTPLPVNSITQSGNEERDLTTRLNNIVDLEHALSDSDNGVNNDIIVDNIDSTIYDLLGESSVDSNQVFNSASWSQWSEWFVAGTTSKVRVRTCKIDGDEVSEALCDGVRIQKKSCDSTNTSQCGKVQNISTLLTEGCGDTFDNLEALSTPFPTPQVSHAPIDKTSTDICHYSLYDTYRQKYIFSHWNLTELMTKSKVKRWCYRSRGQFIVMSTPKDHCWRYYKDLCQTTERCRSEKPTKESSDLTEGCWRSLVYGDLLPAGLSNKEANGYVICQHFAGQSRLGKMFGYREIHFATLYDTRLKTPVYSVNKITRLGDETWPETDYFIEHGLVEHESEMTWLSQKPRKDMLTLRDLERCSNDQGCDLGLRQVLPSDYQDSRDSGYVPTHLMWPELMPPEPDHRLATFTLTNIAPLASSLFQEWHEAMLRVRHYAIEQCGIPILFDSTFLQRSEFSSHRRNKSAMFVISGVVPSSDPVVTTGHDIHVPDMFWFSGCCVKQHSTSTNSRNHNTNISTGSYKSNETRKEGSIFHEIINVTSFSLYILNAPDSHVVVAPVLQLEMRLRDFHTSTSSNREVSLFPVFDSTSMCADLRNDVSQWFQLTTYVRWSDYHYQLYVCHSLTLWHACLAMVR